MAVLVERQNCYCPNCNELLSYTSKDAYISKNKSPTTYHENGKAISKTRVTTSWYITCPTCSKAFLVKKFEILE